MILFENLTIAVDKEGDIFRAYAFNTVTEQNIASCKNKDCVLSTLGIFMQLEEVAHSKVVENDPVNS